MAYFRATNGSGGGTYNPTEVYETKALASNSSYTFTQTSGKTYIAVMSLNYSSSAVTGALQSWWTFKDTTITGIFAPSGLNFTCSVNSGKIKLTNGTGTSASLVIVRLD